MLLFGVFGGIYISKVLFIIIVVALILMVVRR
jgi:hypothetical protein